MKSRTDAERPDAGTANASLKYGVLADMAVTQSSAVMALRRANPGLGAGGLFTGAFSIGRDHLIASVHTLVLVYAGATLPLLLVLQSTVMCMQCMATAMTAGAGVSGTRAYIAHKHHSWITPRRMRAITVSLMCAGLLASATLVSGSSTPTRPSATVGQHAHTR